MKIEAGKTYLDREGMRHKIKLVHIDDRELASAWGYSHIDQCMNWYTPTGAFSAQDGRPSGRGLVSLAPEKKAAKESPKVGVVPVTTTVGPPNPPDSVNHPKHYVAHPSGIECITITEHMGFNLGNAIKYIWRADLKGNAVEDLEKSIWYIQREIAKRQKLPDQRNKTANKGTN